MNTGNALNMFDLFELENGELQGSADLPPIHHVGKPECGRPGWEVWERYERFSMKLRSFGKTSSIDLHHVALDQHGFS